MLGATLSVIAPAVAALVVALLVVGGATPASARPAQVSPTESDEREYLRCFEEVVEDGGSTFDGARRCVPDRDALLDCIGSGRVTAAEVQACVRQQLPGIDDTGAGTDDETTTTTTSPAEVPSTSVPEEAGDDGGGRLDDLDLPIVEGDAEAGDGGDDGFGLPVVVLVGIAGLVAGVLVGRALRKAPTSFDGTVAGAAAVGSSSTDGSFGAGAPTGAPPAGAPVAAAAGPDSTAERAAAEHVAGERDRLVGALIDLADEARSDAVRTTIVQRLAAVGVEPVLVSPGDRFDPTVHRGVHAQPAARPEQADTIAALDRPGWIDRGRVLRPPEVVVHRWDGGSS